MKVKPDYTLRVYNQTIQPGPYGTKFVRSTCVKVTQGNVHISEHRMPIGGWDHFWYEADIARADSRAP